MTTQESADKDEGLALPVRAIDLYSSTEGYNFGWCLVDNNKRVLAPYLTKTQAEQMERAVNATTTVPDSGACKHEPFEGRCVHCNAPFKDGQPVIRKLNNDLFVEQWDRLVSVLGIRKCSVIEAVDEVERRVRSTSGALDVEAVKWAIDLLAIHPGVKINTNSQMWLRRLRKAAGATEDEILHADVDNFLDVSEAASGRTPASAKQPLPLGYHYETDRSGPLPREVIVMDNPSDTTGVKHG